MAASKMIYHEDPEDHEEKIELTSDYADLADYFGTGFTGFSLDRITGFTGFDLLAAIHFALLSSCHP